MIVSRSNDVTLYNLWNYFSCVPYCFLRCTDKFSVTRCYKTGGFLPIALFIMTVRFVDISIQTHEHRHSISQKQNGRGAVVTHALRIRGPRLIPVPNILTEVFLGFRQTRRMLGCYFVYGHGKSSPKLFSHLSHDFLSSLVSVHNSDAKNCINTKMKLNIAKLSHQ